jgi:hypothetical protein
VWPFAIKSWNPCVNRALESAALDVWFLPALKSEFLLVGSDEQKNTTVPIDVSDVNRVLI